MSNARLLPLAALCLIFGCGQTSPPTVAMRLDPSSQDIQPPTVPREVIAKADANHPPGYTAPFPWVVYKSGNDDELKPFAERIAKAIGVPGCQPADHNPVCCVWLELTPWQPNPGEPGYLIHNQAGGSLIQATDLAQMEIAVARFEASVRPVGERKSVPLGILTNFRLAIEAND